jgi:plasmid stabilization system protein ParE
VRVPWSEDALLDLEDIADRAPRAAHHVYDSVRWLAVQQFARLFRPVIGRPGEHVMSVPPYVVVYGVDGDAITVLTIKDGRQVQDPWERAPTGWTLCPCSEFGIDRAGERSRRQPQRGSGSGLGCATSGKSQGAWRPRITALVACRIVHHASNARPATRQRGARAARPR